MPPQYILIERDGPVALVRLNRPEALNAMSAQLMSELIDALEQLDHDRAVRVIVIAGNERAFAAGADLKAMRDRDLATVLTHDGNRFWPRLAAIEAPLIAAVSGFAFGGGCELALACDMIVAAEGARFSQPEITVGIIPGGGGTQRLARTIGKHRAMELVLTGRRITAREASELGLVNRLSSDAEWLDDALDLAREIAGKPPLAIRLAKRAVLAAEETPLATGISFERRLYEIAMATEDRHEGMTAFIERRPPSWQGR